MHAICLELLEPHLRPGARVLDVGSGSGYLTACMGKIVGPQGFVLGVEKVPELVNKSQDSIQQSNPELLSGDAAGSLRIVHGNVLSGRTGLHMRHNAGCIVAPSRCLWAPSISMFGQCWRIAFL